MSKYTTQVRYICETFSGESNVDKAIAGSINNIFDDSWTCWSVIDGNFVASYKEVLEKKILRHYYTREIGLETFELWKLKLNTKLSEIMPYYNELYKTIEKKFDWLKDTDYFREHEGSGEGNNSEQTNDSGQYTNAGSNSGLNMYSDTPQGSLQNVESGTYLTNATKQVNSSSANGSNSNNRNRSGDYKNTDQYLDHVFGKMSGQSFTSLMKEYRDSIINIDLMIIGELSDLFIKLW